jgi:hypothetical protein
MCPLLTDSLSCRRVDACGATLSQSKPRFPLIRHLRNSISRPSIHDIHDHPTVIIGPEIKALAHSLSTSNDLANVLEDMSYLTAFVEFPHRGSTMTQDSTYFDAQRASIQCRILAMPIEEDRFVSVLTIVCSQRKIQSWHDAKEILLKHLWSERIREDSLLV